MKPRRKGQHYCPDRRAAILYMRECGMKYKDIAECFGTTKNAIIGVVWRHQNAEHL